MPFSFQSLKTINFQFNVAASTLVGIKSPHSLYLSVYESVCRSHTVGHSGSPCSRPSRFTQMDCDGHLAQCLSEVNMDVTW